MYNISLIFLRTTSSFFLLTFLFSIYYFTNIHEFFLSTSLLVAFIFSQLFWSNPLKNSFIHKLDAIFAKLSIVYFIFYTITYKKLSTYLFYSYIIFILAVFFSFYMSHYYSSKKWCCNEHIMFHGIGHICCFIACLYAFY